MKILVRIVVVVLILAVLAVGAVAFYIDAIAKGAIERGATYALGVKTTLDRADVGILRGEFSMEGLDVANPEGFDRDHFLKLGDGSVAVKLGSLRQETVELPALTLNNVDMNLEKKGTESNYGVILGNLKKLESKEPDDERQEQQGKKFVVHEVVITDVNVEADVLGKRVEVPIDEIRLTNVGSHGVDTSQLTSVIVKAVLAALMKHARDLPADLVTDLSGSLQALTGLSEMGIQATFDVAGSVTDLAGKTVGQSQEVTKAVGDVGKQIEGVAGDVGDEVGKALDGLLGGKKEKKKED